MAYNSQKHESTGCSPYEIFFGRTPQTFPLEELRREVIGEKGRDVTATLALHRDVQDRISKAQQRQKEVYDKRHQDWTPKKGEWILIHSDHYKARLDPTQRAKVKLEPKLPGPFKIEKEVAHEAYKLQTPTWFKAHNVLPIQALESFYGDPSKVTPRSIAGITEEGGRAERKLGLLGRRPTRFIVENRFDYLVKSAGEIAPTWQSDTRLPGLHWAIKDFVQNTKSETNKDRLGTKDELILEEGKERARALRELETEA
ncbi:hypothetical protein CF326_g6882 [Tilletia indica]|nr:hypothetical protein CF326_g6882 [Tilletia indica]